MSLDTVLKIGKTFRESESGLKHFRYVKQCPLDTDKTSVLRLSLPVNEDFSFDFDNLTEITNENIIGTETVDTKLYYLTFKTSDNDGLVKYIFGDIFYEFKSKLDDKGNIENSEGGYYRLDNPNASKAYQSNSFIRGKQDSSQIINELSNNLFFSSFRDNFEKEISHIHSILKYRDGIKNFFLKNYNEYKISDLLKNEDLLIKFTAQYIFENLKTPQKTLNKIFQKKEKIFEWNDIEKNRENLHKLIKYSNSSVFIHFSFSNKFWYDFKGEFNAIAKKMLLDFVDVDENNRFLLKKTLYKTLCSGDKKNDIQFPGFKNDSKYKSKFFNEEEIKDLFYAIDYSKNSILNPTDDIKLIVLPNGDNITAKDYEDFIHKPSEIDIDKKNTQFEVDSIFSYIDNEIEINSVITKYDMIFSKKGAGVGSPDTDLIELTSIKKSNLQEIKNRIFDIQLKIFNERQKDLHLSKELNKLSILWSFTRVLGSCRADTKTGKIQFKTNNKYQSHMLKVLPQIYTACYFRDNILLPSFIEKVEFSVRHGDSQYSFLKYDLKFLFSIQNSINEERSNFMKIVESDSYNIGLLIGRLARNFAGESSPIKSFEKNYVGNLTRRITTLRDLIEFKNDIEQKLIMHDKAKYTFKDSNELSDKIKLFSGSYDKNECAFGFFESYFNKPTKKTLVEKIELELEKGKSEPANDELIQKVKEVINIFKEKE